MTRQKQRNQTMYLTDETRMLMEYTKTQRPEEYAQIPNPIEHFSALGEQMADQIADLAREIAGPDPAGEEYLAKVARLTQAKLQAAELVREDYCPTTTEEYADEESEPSLTWELTKLMHQTAWESHQEQLEPLEGSVDPAFLERVRTMSW